MPAVSPVVQPERRRSVQRAYAARALLEAKGLLESVVPLLSAARPYTGDQGEYLRTLSTRVLALAEDVAGVSRELAAEAKEI